jgi:hypothetical protein
LREVENADTFEAVWRYAHPIRHSSLLPKTADHTIEQSGFLLKRLFCTPTVTYRR